MKVEKVINIEINEEEVLKLIVEKYIKLEQDEEAILVSSYTSIGQYSFKIKAIDERISDTE